MKTPKTLFLAFLVLLLPLVVLAADPTPTPAPAPAVKLQFTLPLADGTTATAVFLPGANGQTLLVYIAGGKLVTGTLILDNGNIVPPPNPVPPIPPPPPPPPIEKIWGLVIVEESGTLTPEQGQIVTSKVIGDYVALKGWKKSVYDKDVTDENDKQIEIVKAYSARAKSFPYFFVVDLHGQVATEGTLPSEANLLGILQKIGGDAK